MKKYIKKVLILVALFISTYSLNAQQTSDYEYDSEILWGVTKATNSGLIGGVILRFSNRIGSNKFQHFGLELVNVKHPQEERVPTGFGNSYIHGKVHYLYSIRMQYGRDWVFFRKAPQQGVQVSGHLAVGPTLGLEAPYYVEIESGNNSRRVPYDPSRNYQIRGSGNIFQGIEESSIVPGINLKSSVSFEFGTFKSNVVGFEVGMMVEAFTREIELIADNFVDNNQQIFPNAFITLFYGSRK